MARKAFTTSIRSASSDVRGSLSRAKKPILQLLSGQVAVQAIMLITGLLLMRTMSKTEYAFFTIANSMQSTMTLLADVGISSALTAAGGKVWQDDYRLGQVIHAGLQVRHLLGFIACLFVFPLSFWMLYSQGAHFLAALTISLIIVITAGFQLNTGVINTVIQLRSRVHLLNWGTLTPNLIRLLLSFLACLLFVNAFIAALITLSSVVAQYFLYLHWVKKEVQLDAPPEPQDKAFMWDKIKQQFLNGIYYSLQGQVGLFFMALVGTSNNIADVGALARFSTVFVVINSLLGNFAAPRFARIQAKNQMAKRYWQIIFVWAISLTSLVFVLSLLRGPILALMGSKYSHLSAELLICLMGGAAMSFSTAFGSLNRARAWASYTWMYVPLSMAWMVLLLTQLNMSHTRDVVIFGALSFVPSLLINVSRGVYGLYWEKNPITSAA